MSMVEKRSNKPEAVPVENDIANGNGKSMTNDSLKNVKIMHILYSWRFYANRDAVLRGKPTDCYWKEGETMLYDYVGHVIRR